MTGGDQVDQTCAIKMVWGSVPDLPVILAIAGELDVARLDTTTDLVEVCASNSFQTSESWLPVPSSSE